jgi:hypothetical protein
LFDSSFFYAALLKIGGMRDLRNSCTILVVKAVRKIPIRRRRRRWEDNIKINLKDVCAGVKWTNLAKNRGQWRVLLNTAS